ncbi:MAG: hypothetical protein Q8N73_01570 [bacterium]|nr:hypothetical protein [bacterium]
MNWKHILIVIILAVIVGGGILAYQYLKVPKEEIKAPEVPGGGAIPPKEVIETPRPEPSEKPGWKVYTNRVFNYQMEFPEEILAEEYSAGGLATDKSEEVNFVLPYYPGAESVSALQILTPGITPEEAELSLEEFVSQSVKGFVKKEEITIGGETAIKLTFSKEREGSISIGTKERTPGGLVKGRPYFGEILLDGREIIFMKHPIRDDMIFLIFLLYREKDRETAQDLFNQMLSTFQFLK